jgi:hypothetical protein
LVGGCGSNTSLSRSDSDGDIGVATTSCGGTGNGICNDNGTGNSDNSGSGNSSGNGNGNSSGSGNGGAGSSRKDCYLFYADTGAWY